MQLWKLILAYDGTPFNGWQIQPGLLTIQGTLAQALHHLTGETVLPQGSGRTDAGVHALAQVASFALAAPIPPANLLRALNRALPRSIRVLSATHAPNDFHARHSALAKTYEYRIFPAVPTRSSLPSLQPGLPHRERPSCEGCNAPTPVHTCSPFLAPYVWDCPRPLSLALMQAAAPHLLGTHDFTSFAAVDPDRTTRNPNHKQEPATLGEASPSPIAESAAPTSDAPRHCTIESAVPNPAEAPATPHAPSPTHPDPLDPTRTIHHATWHLSPEGLFLFRITGTGFLHHMVRNLIGTFVDIGAARTAPGAIPRILAARSRSAAGPTAPARGLFLVEVLYP